MKSQFVMFNINEKERGREISCPFKNSVLIKEGQGLFIMTMFYSHLSATVT